jgi:AraC-like DNA-binding protein
MQIDFFNPRSIIVFICIVQGLIFADLLVLRGWRKRTQADFWLALLLLLLCSALITPFIGFANVYDLNQWLTYFPFSIAYSYGVCVWFYTLHLTDAKRKFKRKDLLFFLPTFLYLLVRFALFAQSLEFKGWFGKTYGNYWEAFVFVTEFAWNLAFLYLSLKHYKKYRAWLDDNFSDTEKIKFDWLRNFLYVFTAVLTLGGIFDFTNSFIFRLSYIQYFYFELVLALVTYGLAIAGYLRSQTIELNFAPPVSEPEERKAPVSETELARLKNRLQGLMEQEKLYLEPMLTLTDLARNLGVNTTVLSYAINAGFAKNFNDFINEFRIREAKAKLAEGEAGTSTMLGLAFDCGFNSKATFNRAFKKFTGLAPKEFQEKQTQKIA